jgi:hypothetical protein
MQKLIIISLMLLALTSCIKEERPNVAITEDCKKEHCGKITDYYSKGEIKFMRVSNFCTGNIKQIQLISFTEYNTSDTLCFEHAW